jgi:NADH dehydrogenase
MSSQSSPRTARHRVVIVGAGFGGLSVAKALRKSPVEITILDRRIHLFQPLLYQVATAALSPGDISWPVRSIFASQPNARVLMMDVNGVDVEARTVTDQHDVVPYDYLVLATAQPRLLRTRRMGAVRSRPQDDRRRKVAPGEAGSGAS